MSVHIALTGVGGSGKTTLAKAISNQFGIHLISEQFRAAAYRTGYTPADIATRKWIYTQFLGLALQGLQEESHKDVSFITDRTTYDYVSYTKGIAEEYAPDTFTPLVDAIKVAASKIEAGPYDVVIVVPPHGQGVEKDGFRAISDKFCLMEQKVIEDVIRRAKEDGIKVMTLTTFSVHDRISEIIKSAFWV